MKKVFVIIFCFFYVNMFSQENEKIYLYVNHNSFWPALLGYKAVIGIKSKDKRFMHDNYLFKIDYKDLDYQTLYSLGIPVNISNIGYIENPAEYFRNYSNWELHEKFSLYKTIFIITKIPKKKLEQMDDKSKTYIMFPAHYRGTQKNTTWVNNTGRKFIDQ